VGLHGSGAFDNGDAIGPGDICEIAGRTFVVGQKVRLGSGEHGEVISDGEASVRTTRRKKLRGEGHVLLEGITEADRASLVLTNLRGD
jgi:hypothetical protein